MSDESIGPSCWKPRRARLHWRAAAAGVIPVTRSGSQRVDSAPAARAILADLSHDPRGCSAIVAASQPCRARVLKRDRARPTLSTARGAVVTVPQTFQNNGNTLFVLAGHRHTANCRVMTR